MKNSLEQLSHHLKAEGLRLTAERRKLAQAILGLKGHFGIDDILVSVKRRRLNVSRATVYRVMPVLVKAGLIQQSLLSEGQARFEVVWNRDHHDHLICSACDKIIEFHHKSIEILQREVADKFGFVLDHHVMELLGRCQACRG
jgi:Fur family ferric uptake transcriptional regulator